MEFLVEFDIHIPDGAPESEVEQRVSGEVASAERLACEGHLVRLWTPTFASDGREALGLFRADNEAELDGLLNALPLSPWMLTSVTPLEPHPNHPTSSHTGLPHLPRPHLTFVYRLEATLGDVLDLGDFAQGHRRIVPWTGGTFAGPQLSGRVVPGVSADWQTVLADGTAVGDIRYALHTRRRPALRRITRGASRPC